jgi:hypothetical protein
VAGAALFICFSEKQGSELRLGDINWIFSLGGWGVRGLGDIFCKIANIGLWVQPKNRVSTLWREYHSSPTMTVRCL